MNRIDALNKRYAATRAISQNGVEIVAVGDPTGARLNAAVRRLTAQSSIEGGEYLYDLLGAAKAMRWVRLTQPQPESYGSRLLHLANEIERLCRRMRGAIADESILEELATAALEVVETPSPVGEMLLRSCIEVGIGNCIVVAVGRPAVAGLSTWLLEQKIPVVTTREFTNTTVEYEQAYIVGPPRFYESSLTTSPSTSSMSFLLPSWFHDRVIPQTAIAAYAEGAIRVRPRIFMEGDITEPEGNLQPDTEDEFLPQPLWGGTESESREPSSEEVVAHKILLSGQLAIWLDDGERIRTLDPIQPVGERVTYTDVSAVRQGTYLLLRQGETERGSLYKKALERLEDGEAVGASQVEWKQALSEQIRVRGHKAAVRELRALGVSAAERVRAWTDPNLIRPHRDHDFEGLLRWLKIDHQPTFHYANRLRKSLYQVSAEVREELETAVSCADLSQLEARGNLSLDAQSKGIRGLIATRVLAISPFTKIVHRRDSRVLLDDGSGIWLE